MEMNPYGSPENTAGVGVVGVKTHMVTGIMASIAEHRSAIAGIDL